MALTATLHRFEIELSDVDRGVYETLELRVARQPSETAAFLVTRVLAYCLEFREGIAFTEGVAAGDEPAICVRDLTGKMTAWIEVGMPDAARLHRGMKLAGSASLYTHRDPANVLRQFSGEKIHRSAEIPIIAFDPKFIDTLAEAVEKRTTLSLSVTDRELYVEIGGRTIASPLAEIRIP